MTKVVVDWATVRVLEAFCSTYNDCGARETCTHSHCQCYASFGNGGPACDSFTVVSSSSSSISSR